MGHHHLSPPFIFSLMFSSSGRTASEKDDFAPYGEVNLFLVVFNPQKVSPHCKNQVPAVNKSCATGCCPFRSVQSSTGRTEKKMTCAPCLQPIWSRQNKNLHCHQRQSNVPVTAVKHYR